MSTVVEADANETEVGSAPAEGKITPKAIRAAENMIGMQLRPEGPYLQDATEDTIRNFCNGIGDLNPLYRDLEVGRLTRHGSMLAHPNFPMAFGWVGRTRWGLPGVHGFYAGNDWEIFRHIRPGDRLTAIERQLSIRRSGTRRKCSRFSVTSGTPRRIAVAAIRRSASLIGSPRRRRRA